MKNVLIALLSISLIASCGVLGYVKQDLAVSYRLNEGMTKVEVEAVMGAPIKTDFFKQIDEWFYCKTGTGSDEHLALFFHNGKLVAKRNYTVTMADTRGTSGSCEKFIKMGNYQVPDIVVEIRNR